MFSIVIPAYNESEHIARCLASLTTQDTTEPFEVIVVDNASTDRTGEIARSFSNRLNLKVIREERKGRGVARSAGCRMAKGEIIFSIDADTVAPTNWISNHRTALKTRNTIAVSGPVRINDCGILSNAIFNFIQPLSMHLYRICFGHYWLTGSNFAIWKTVYDQAGGFDSSLTSSEDTEFAIRVKKIGRIRYSPTPTLSSGRRFRKNLLIGLIAYPWTWIEKFVLKKKDVELEDVR